MKSIIQTVNYPQGEFQSRVLEQTHQKIAKMLNNICKNSNERGTFFFRSDTGTGKTTGFISAVVDLVAQGYSIAIAVPTIMDAQEIYLKLADGLGDQVEVWTSDHSKGLYGRKVNKNNLLKVPVFVGCHAFLMGLADDPKRFIGHKDLLIVDEIPTNLQINSLTYTDFAKAREKASELGLNAQNTFVEADDWVRERQKKAEEEVNQAAFHKITDTVASHTKQVRDDLGGLHSGDRAVLVPVLDYIDALRDDRGFERVQRTSRGHIVHHVYFEDVARHFNKSVVFSATVHLDGFQYSPNKERLNEFEGSFVKYPHLDIQEVPYPNISKAARYLLQKPNELEIAVAHIKDIISRTEIGSNVLVIVPKAIRERVEKEITQNFGHHNSEIHVTNWGRDVGSNEYRNCSEVILWSNYHKPKHTTFSELCLYAEERVNDTNLKEVDQGKFSGRVKSLEESQLYASIKQMGSRGTTRFVDDEGNAWPMRLWISWAELKPELLQEIFPDSTFTRSPVRDDRFMSKPNRSFIPKLIDFLTTVEADEVTMSEVANTIPNVRKNSQKIIKEIKKFNIYGWDFCQGKPGRNGYEAKFIVTNKNSKPRSIS